MKAAKHTANLVIGRPDGKDRNVHGIHSSIHNVKDLTSVSNLDTGVTVFTNLIRTIPTAGSPNWWSQTGSNRRPPPCKGGALPAELWPREVRLPPLCSQQ